MSTHDDLDLSTSGRHPVHVTHLVFGVVLASCVALWALLVTDILPSSDLRWLLPLPWLLAGAAGLLAVTLGGRSRSRAPREPVEQPAGTESGEAATGTSETEHLGL